MILILLLINTQVVNIPEDILKAKQEVEAEFFGEDQNWVRGETNVCNSVPVLFLTFVVSFIIMF